MAKRENGRSIRSTQYPVSLQVPEAMKEKMSSQYLETCPELETLEKSVKGEINVLETLEIDVHALACGVCKGILAELEAKNVPHLHLVK